MAPLSEQQKELLSAFADGEVSDEERVEASELLEREDAQAYLDEIQALGDLVHKHGPVRAPVGLSGRVMGKLEDEFKQPEAPQAGPGEEPFHGPITFSWRTPLYAAAAAIIVSLAIMFGPSLVTPDEDPAQTVAREALKNLPAEDGTDVIGDEKPEGTNGDPTTDDLVEKESMNGDPAEYARSMDKLSESERELHDAMEENSTRKARGEKSEVEKVADVEDEAREELAKKGKGDWRARNDVDGENGGVDERDEELEEQQADEKSEDGVDGGSAAGLGGGGRAVERDAQPGADPEGNAPPESSEADDDPESKSRSKDEDDRNRANNPTAPKRPAEQGEEGDGPEKRGPANEPAEDAAEVPDQPAPSPEAESGPMLRRAAQAEEVIELSLSEAKGLLAQNDVLWVATLHGDAEINEDAEGNENVAVELEREQLDELVKALRRLADDQGYGDVKGSSVEIETPTPATAGPGDDSSSARISGYVPSKSEDRAAMAGAAKPDDRVRVVIKLN